MLIDISCDLIIIDLYHLSTCQISSYSFYLLLLFIYLLLFTSMPRHNHSIKTKCGIIADADKENPEHLASKYQCHISTIYRILQKSENIRATRARYNEKLTKVYEKDVGLDNKLLEFIENCRETGVQDSSEVILMPQ